MRNLNEMIETLNRQADELDEAAENKLPNAPASMFQICTAMCTDMRQLAGELEEWSTRHLGESIRLGKVGEDLLRRVEGLEAREAQRRTARRVERDIASKLARVEETPGMVERRKLYAKDRRPNPVVCVICGSRADREHKMTCPAWGTPG